MSEWILCKDRMPDARWYDLTLGEILVTTRFGKIDLVNFINGKFAKWDGQLLEWHYINQENIQAWAEIPAPLEDDGGTCDGEEIED